MKRSRLTVFFRGALAFPHLILVLLWGIAAEIVRHLSWIVGTVMGRLPAWMHNFLAGYVRYSTVVLAYRMFVAAPFPPFSGKAGSYPPLDAVIPAPEPQSRASIFFRPVMAVPAVIALFFYAIWALLLWVVAFFYCLVMGRISAGLHRRLTNFVCFDAQTTAYRLRLTDSYPFG